ncbi:peptidylprolyl isomerase [Candidatus Neomarinimicrobiota bacterium]
MTKAKIGDRVKVHYRGELADGTEFDSSGGKEPIEFTLGENTVIEGFEKALLGMEVGQKRKITLSADEAYGEVKDELIIDVSKSQLPPDMEPKVGMMLQASSAEGGKSNVTIVALKEETVTIDGNHPLAGQTLHFDLELIEIG